MPSINVASPAKPSAFSRGTGADHRCHARRLARDRARARQYPGRTPARDIRERTVRRRSCSTHGARSAGSLASKDRFDLLNPLIGPSLPRPAKMCGLSPDAARPAHQDDQPMSKHRVLSFKPCLRLEWRGPDDQNETEQPNHSSSLSDSVT